MSTRLAQVRVRDAAATAAEDCRDPGTLILQQSESACA